MNIKPPLHCEGAASFRVRQIRRMKSLDKTSGNAVVNIHQRGAGMAKKLHFNTTISILFSKNFFKPVEKNIVL